MHYPEIGNMGPLSPREDERERITRARRAAEALFTTKRQVPKLSSVSDSLLSVHQSPREPRVLKALPPAPVRDLGRYPLLGGGSAMWAMRPQLCVSIAPWIVGHGYDEIFHE